MTDHTFDRPVADFYSSLPRIPEFTDLSRFEAYRDVPSDWLIGVADIVDSTAEIAAGRYKTVNMVGAAVISATINAVAPREFPYVFGGDGAGFAIWPEARPAVEAALAAVQAWARREFGISLRAALVPVADAAAAGKRLRIARFQAAEEADYAMFTGGALRWAEDRLKAGEYAVPTADPAAVPDLTGLSCRWSNQQARNGTILSAVIMPGPAADEAAFAKVARAVLQIGDGLAGGGRPLPRRGPGMRYPPPGLDIDARVSHGTRALWVRKVQILAENFLFWLIFLFRVRLGRFDPEQYRADVSANADFRKFDDGLKMTLDCDNETRRRIESVLEQADSRGIVRYGLSTQDEAMVTCFVPSPTQRDHVHFIDGAGGGYAKAAARIKAAHPA